MVQFRRWCFCFSCMRLYFSLFHHLHFVLCFILSHIQTFTHLLICVLLLFLHTQFWMFCIIFLLAFITYEISNCRMLNVIFNAFLCQILRLMAIFLLLLLLIPHSLLFILFLCLILKLRNISFWFHIVCVYDLNKQPASGIFNWYFVLLFNFVVVFSFDLVKWR